MSWDLNRVIVVGRLAADPELKYTPGGTSVTKFGVAVGGKPKADGTDTVSFFNVTVWGKAGEACVKYTEKGKRIAIDGRLEQKRWSAEDGTKRSVVEIVAERVEFIDFKGTEKPQAPEQPEAQPESEQPDPDNPNF